MALTQYFSTHPPGRPPTHPAGSHAMVSPVQTKHFELPLDVVAAAAAGGGGGGGFAAEYAVHRTKSD